MSDLEDLIEVEWYDAASGEEELHKLTASKDYFVKRTAYGKLLVLDEYGIILATDIDELGNCEYTAIPRPWLTPKTDKKLYEVNINENYR